MTCLNTNTNAHTHPRLPDPHFILVLCGGTSTERDVSLSSGARVASALVGEGFSVCLWDVCRDIALPADPKTLFTREAPEVPAIRETVSCDTAGMTDVTPIGRGVLDLCRAADVVFLALHGGMGENGQLQATLDNFRIPYTGSGYLGSAIAMDKDISKRLLRAAHLPTPDWLYAPAGELAGQIDAIEKAVGIPCVIKTCSGGSSVGVSLCDTEEDVKAALAAADPRDPTLAERRIYGRELTVGVLDGTALPAIEIIPKSGFYDYRNKYQAGMTTDICPADLEEKTAREAAALAQAAFAALRLSGYARFDMMLDGDGGLWILEANTLPGMTPTSLVPQEAACIGYSYADLCEKIVMDSLEARKAERK